MNQETIENLVKGLGKNDFDSVVRLILEKVFHLRFIDVDGKGDGGSDLRVFDDPNSNRTIAIQKTVQEANWESKALEDAKKAKDKLGAKRYFFLTSRARESSALRKLESTISATLMMPSTCLGATEIAGLTLEGNLLSDFAHAINLQLNIDYPHRPDQREILLHSYFALSDDRKDLQNEIYENALLSYLHHSPPLSREQLVTKVIDSLNLSEHKRSTVSGRVDALLARGKLLKSGDFIALGAETKADLQFADGIYQKELSQLASVHAALVSEYGGEWDQEKSQKVALLMAKSFVEEQIQVAKNASLSFSMTGFGREITGAKEELETLILNAGISKQKCGEALNKIIDISSDSPLIKKLAASVVYVALETPVENKTSMILGKSSWRESKVIIDTSAAIPYLLSSLFAPSKGRFAVGSTASLSFLRKHGANLCIPWVYLNECASHLINATDYCENLEGFEESLKYSQNGYVSHYWQLKSLGAAVPETLKEYLFAVSEATSGASRNKPEAVRKAMQDLQPLLNNYGVNFENIPPIPDRIVQDVQTEYVYCLQKLSRKKNQMLIDHDVKVLAHMSREQIHNSSTYICLTWDGVMIEVGKALRNAGWIVNPVEASDLFQAGLKLSDGKLLSLAHAVGRAQERVHELSARILDRTVLLASEKLADWQFKEKVKEFQQQAIKQRAAEGSLNLDKFDSETDKFLIEQGVHVPNNQPNSSETEE